MTSLNDKDPIIVIDPAVISHEADCFAALKNSSPLPLKLVLPGLKPEVFLPPLENAKGVLILGSNSSVHDDLPWQKTLRHWLDSELDALVPLLGICFGHQLVAHHFSAKVRFLNENKSKHLGVNKIEMNESPWFPKGSHNLFSSHREIVSECPKGFTVWAKSNTIPIEGLKHSSLPVWTLQPHPEATLAFVNQRGGKASQEELKVGASLVESFLKFVAR